MQHLLLLHGALGAAADFRPLKQKLGTDYSIHAINFPGHGGESLPERPFSVQSFADAVLEYMKQNQIDRASIFGYSLGGYVGMYMAKHNPGSVEKLITLATKFYWDEAIATKEVKMLNTDSIQQKVPAFAQELAEKHAPIDWKDVVHRVVALLIQLGNNNTLKTGMFSSINVPCLLLLGDRDKMVTLDETIAVYKELPDAQLGVIPKTPHPFVHADPGLLAALIQRFLQ